MRRRWRGWARIDPELLYPVKHRSVKAQADLMMIRARAGLVRARTGLVNTARGRAKSYGERLRGGNVRNLNPEKAESLSPELQAALEPLLNAIESLSERILESEGALHFRVQLWRKDRIAIVNEEVIGMIARNGVPQLLEGPSRRRMSRHIAMQNAAASVLQGHEHEQNPETCGPRH